MSKRDFRLNKNLASIQHFLNNNKEATSSAESGNNNPSHNGSKSGTNEKINYDYEINGKCLSNDINSNRILKKSSCDHHDVTRKDFTKDHDEDKENWNWKVVDEVLSGGDLKKDGNVNVEKFKCLFKKQMQNLAANDHSTVSQPLKFLSNVLHRWVEIVKDANAASEKLTELQRFVVNECLNNVKSMLRLFQHRTESVRLGAIELVTNFIPMCKDHELLLPYLFPVLLRRSSDSFSIDFKENQFYTALDFYDEKIRGKAIPLPHFGTDYKHNVVEPSEEVRLALCKCVARLLDEVFKNQQHCLLAPYFHDLIIILHASARDTFPDLKIFALDQFSLLCLQQEFWASLTHYCVALIRSFMHCLNHRLAKVRIRTIITVKNLIMLPNEAKYRGAGAEAILDLIGFREDNVLPICAFYQGETRINYFGLLMEDMNTKVRHEFFQMMSDLMVKMVNAYEYYARTLPFLLAGLCDSENDIIILSKTCLLRLGEIYEKENEVAIREKRQLNVDGKPFCNYTKQLPYPFTVRPDIGERLFVRQHAKRFTHAILREISDWRPNTRLQSAKLLKVCLVYLEEEITMEYEELLRNLIKHLFSLCQDQNVSNKRNDNTVEIIRELEACVELTGRFVDSATYIPFMKQTILEENCDVAHKTIRIRVLRLLVSGSKPKTVSKMLLEVSKLAAHEELLTAMVHERLQCEIFALLEEFSVKVMRCGRSYLESVFLAESRVCKLDSSLKDMLLVVITCHGDRDNVEKLVFGLLPLIEGLHIADLDTDGTKLIPKHAVISLSDDLKFWISSRPNLSQKMANNVKLVCYKLNLGCDELLNFPGL